MRMEAKHDISATGCIYRRSTEARAKRAIADRTESYDAVHLRVTLEQIRRAKQFTGLGYDYAGERQLAATVCQSRWRTVRVQKRHDLTTSSKLG